MLRRPQRSSPAVADAKSAGTAPQSAAAKAGAVSKRAQRQQVGREAAHGNGPASLIRQAAAARAGVQALAAASSRQVAIPAEASAGLTTAVLR